MVLEIAGLAMFRVSKIDRSVRRVRSLAVLIVLVVAHPVNAQSVSEVPVNIYGDGNPVNGVEDSRESLAVSPAQSTDKPGQTLSAGTITCDGKFRGTAMVVDTRELTSGIKGVVLVSAAHVIFNLHKKKRFRHCRFYFMGWERPAGYGSKIDLKRTRMGDFDPGQETSGFAFGEGDWVFLYVPKPWKHYQPDQSIRLRNFIFSNTESFQQSGGEFSLVAFDTGADVIRQSKNCTVVESRPDDIGGGTWKGQLLDDCDSMDGASGGGVLAEFKQQQFLIGIRNGSHWNERMFPIAKYPLGPPDGSVWNRHSNTNFGRAIDARLLHEIAQFIHVLEE